MATIRTVQTIVADSDAEWATLNDRAKAVDAEKYVGQAWTFDAASKTVTVTVDATAAI